MGEGVRYKLGFFDSRPTQGEVAVLFDWAGRDEGSAELSRVVELPAGEPRLEFDYRAAWTPTRGELPRRFSVSVGPPEGPPAFTQLVLEESRVETFDTGDLEGSIALAAFAGESVRIAFHFEIAQRNTSSAQIQLDDVRIAPEPAAGAGAAAALGALLAVRRLRRAPRSRSPARQKRTRPDADATPLSALRNLAVALQGACAAERSSASASAASPNRGFGPLERRFHALPSGSPPRLATHAICRADS